MESNIDFSAWAGVFKGHKKATPNEREALVEVFQTEINNLQAQLDTVKRESKMHQIKADYCERNHAFCPGHRDKLKPGECLSCEMETMQRKLSHQLDTVTVDRDALRVRFDELAPILKALHEDYRAQANSGMVLWDHHWALINWCETTTTTREVPKE